MEFEAEIHCANFLRLLGIHTVQVSSEALFVTTHSFRGFTQTFKGNAGRKGCVPSALHFTVHSHASTSVPKIMSAVVSTASLNVLRKTKVLFRFKVTDFVTLQCAHPIVLEDAHNSESKFIKMFLCTGGNSHRLTLTFVIMTVLKSCKPHKKKKHNFLI